MVLTTNSMLGCKLKTYDYKPWNNKPCMHSNMRLVIDVRSRCLNIWLVINNIGLTAMIKPTLTLQK